MPQFMLVQLLFIESNPAPTKQLMELMGLCSASVRAPLVQCSDETTEKLKAALKANNLL